MVARDDGAMVFRGLIDIVVTSAPNERRKGIVWTEGIYPNIFGAFVWVTLSLQREKAKKRRKKISQLSVTNRVTGPLRESSTLNKDKHRHYGRSSVWHRATSSSTPRGTTTYEPFGGRHTYQAMGGLE